MSRNHKYNLAKESELRIEVDWPNTIEIQLLEGTAEIFGTELAVERVFRLSACKIAIFTWHGCTIEVNGIFHAYEANETPMIMYLNAHAVIEERRKKAEAEGGPPVRVLIAGPTDSGKSSLARILLGYSARIGRKPIFVDLDVGQGHITIPGMIAAIQVDRPWNIEEGFSSNAPLCYFYGHSSPVENEECYKRQIGRLCTQLESLMESRASVRSSGMIVNTCGYILGKGKELLVHSIRAIKANVVIVIDNERLYNDLGQELRSSNTQVVKLPKSGGVVGRDVAFRQKSRAESINQYFYGPKKDLCPHTRVVNWNEVAIYRVGGGPQAPLSALPIGAESTQDPVRLVLINPSHEIVHSVVAISYCDDPTKLLDENIAGYLYISDVNTEKRKVTFLAPSTGPLPSRYLLVGSLKWLE